MLADGVWSDIDTKGTTDTLFDVAEISPGTLVATGENGMLFVGTPELGLQPFDTKWYGDFVAIHPDGAGGAWLLGSAFTTTRDEVVLLHWTGGAVAELPGEAPWYNLADGPSGELLVVGGEEGSVIGIGSDAGIVPTWTIPGITPLQDLALAEDGTVYTTAARARDGVFGRYADGWDSVDLGGGFVLDEVEASSSGVLFLTTDEVLRWDGVSAVAEPLPAGNDPTWIGLAADGDAAYVAGWSYDASEERGLALVVRDELGWTNADVSALPGIAFFSLAVDEDGTLWLGGFDHERGLPRFVDRDRRHRRRRHRPAERRVRHVAEGGRRALGAPRRRHRRSRLLLVRRYLAHARAHRAGELHGRSRRREPSGDGSFSRPSIRRTTTRPSSSAAAMTSGHRSRA